MVWQSYLTRRNVLLFSIFGLGGSYFVLKSMTLAERRRQRKLEGDLSVQPERSGGGI